MFDENLKRQFFSTHKFSYINKFTLLLWKGFYYYEYMNDWGKFNETSLPEEDYFFNKLNAEDIITRKMNL